MALTVPRYVESRLPPRKYRKVPIWLPSIASLSFTAALGVVLLLQSLAVAPGRIGEVQNVAGIARVPAEPGANRTSLELQQAILTEQARGHSTRNFAPLANVSNPGDHAAPPLIAIESRPDELLTAAADTATPAAPTEIPQATSTPAPSPTPPPFTSSCAESGPLYCVYEVKPGETLATIARLAGLQSTEEIAGHEILVHSNRAALNSADDVLVAGEKLRIPSQQGILHTVISEETLSEIAARYGVKAEDIIGVPANQIRDRNTLSAGAEILVPNPTRLGRSLAVPASVGDAGGSGVLSWPAVGGITSYFGPSHPLGIDIALMPGDRVTAAAGGTVTFSGGNPCCSYGLFVIIDHGNGIHTLYGHLSVLYVDEGDEVDRGEAIGLGGYTGFGTGPHLHFEVHVGGMLFDPLAYLP